MERFFPQPFAGENTSERRILRLGSVPQPASSKRRFQDWLHHGGLEIPGVKFLSSLRTGNTTLWNTKVLQMIFVGNSKVLQRLSQDPRLAIFLWEASSRDHGSAIHDLPTYSSKNHLSLFFFSITFKLDLPSIQTMEPRTKASSTIMQPPEQVDTQVFAANDCCHVQNPIVSSDFRIRRMPWKHWMQCLIIYVHMYTIYAFSWLTN